MQELIGELTDNPDVAVHDLATVSVAVGRSLSTARGVASSPHLPFLPIHALFEVQVGRTPDAIAVEFNGECLTYRALNEKANQLARYLNARGVGLETMVGIFLERSVDMIVALVAVLKAGGAYLPLDTNYPPERLRFMLDDATAPIVLTERRLAERLPPSAAQNVCLNDICDEISVYSADNHDSPVNADNLAYVMYTSGSTGTPNGAEITHRGIVRLVTDPDYVRFSAGDTFLQFAPISFDASTFEIWGCLLNGGRLVVFPPHLPNLKELGAFIRRHNITTLWLTSKLFQIMVAERVEDLGGVRQLLTGGDIVPASSARHFLLNAPGATLINGYGPTENTTFTCCYSVTRPEQITASVPIGRPIAGTSVYVLDKNRQPVPVGVPGELYTGGFGLARGYRNRPEKTAERFIPNPFHDKEDDRLYRTGDRVCWLPDGNLEFIGRVDHQLKIRGYRIELGEVEEALRAYPDIQEAAVVAYETENGDRQLAAFLTGSIPESGMASRLREFLSLRLPGYMIPARFVFCEALPETPSGKIDRLKLLDLLVATKPEQEEDSEPIGEVEARLKALWEKMLSRKSIGVLDNFFDIGGHSLLAIQLLDAITRTFNISLTLAEFFRTPTVRQMARLLREWAQERDIWSPLVALQPYGELPPLFCAPVGGGSAFYYRYLAMHIGSDRPLYTFEPLGMHQGDKPHESVEEMAAYYLRFLRSVQPEGPYHLCGLSFGGLIAYEMAQQLTASGERVASLIFFDSWAPGYPETVRVSGNAHRRKILRNGRYHIHAHWDSLDALSSLSERGMYIVSRVTRLPERIQAVYRSQSFGKHRANPASAELPENFQKIQQSQEKAQKDYLPGSYSGSAVLLRARVQDPQWQYQASMGWERFVNDLEVIVTPGTHYTMLDEPCIHRTLEQVRHVLKRSET